MAPLSRLLFLLACLLGAVVDTVLAQRSHSADTHGHGAIHRRLDIAERASSNVIGPIADLHIVNAQVAPDGFSRSAVLANGIFPGPLITGYRGEYFALNVINGLTDNTMRMSTSIHWHGFFQKGRNWVDGPAFINQCPIAPGHSFSYDFTTYDQPGTYWYHSHLSTQYCDGLRGAIVVYDLLDPYRWMYDVDNAGTVITLADWYHTVAPELVIGESDATLINGKGRYAGGPNVDLAVVSVRHGVRYRMRLVSISCDPNFTFSIDKHTMTIIEVDGITHKPYTVDQIQIFAAQRYSFVALGNQLTANQAVGNYWIRADPNVGTTGFDNGLNSAILRYVGAPTSDPTTTQTGGSSPLVESDMIPLFNRAAPGKPVVDGADVNINLDVVFDLETFKFTINGKTFVPPTVPVLLQILSGAKTAAELLPEGNLFSLPPNKVVQISFPGGALGGPHPIHLHGHAFSVVRSAGSSKYNFVNPPQRDVVSMGGAGDNVTIRFRTDNVGPWFMHCHIDWHMDLGLAVVFAENTGAVPWTNNPSAAWKQLCPIYDALPKSQQ